MKAILAFLSAWLVCTFVDVMFAQMIYAADVVTLAFYALFNGLVIGVILISWPRE